ncbi:MAG: hypothetical protein MJ120_00080 [Clostridia bacterium]|nr:hypothetical protein [Clostridia bacterium]
MAKSQDIAKICQKRGSLHLYTNADGSYSQWVSDSVGMYLLEDTICLKDMSTEGIRAIFDMSDNEKYTVNICPIKHFATYLEDYYTEENIAEAKLLPLKIGYQKSVYCCFKTEQGIIAQNEKYFKPFKNDIANCAFFIRYTPKGSPLIVVMMGIFMEALIMPFNFEKDEKFKKAAMELSYFAPVIEEEKSEED